MYNTSPKILLMCDIPKNKHYKQCSWKSSIKSLVLLFSVFLVRFVVFPANMLPVAAGNYFTVCFVNYLVILTALILTCTMFSLLEHLIEADTISEFRGVNKRAVAELVTNCYIYIFFTFDILCMT